MSRMEEYNYWHDHRTIEGMINHGKVDESTDPPTLIIDTGDDEIIKLRCKYDVCGTCRGRGQHVNPSIDCCGLTAEDFYEDPDFAEDYMRGVYDQTCNECGGKRVVPIVDRENNKKEDVEAYDKHMKDQYDDARMTASERAMGA